VRGITLWDLFTDPIFMAPTIASCLMCLVSSLVGVLVFLRRRSLLGEAISHATYPGIALAIILQATFFPNFGESFPILIFIGGAISGFLGMKCIQWLEERFSVSSDVALCFVLSSFLGVGILLASRLQFSYPVWYQKVQMYLYGQAATLISIHIWIYAGLASFVIALFLLCYYPIKWNTFDPLFSKISGVNVKWIDRLFLFLLLFSILIGMRSVGVILMAGMLIIPAVAARQLTRKLSSMFLVAGSVGICSAIFGNYLSIYIPLMMYRKNPDLKIILPSGPLILIVGAFIAFAILLFAPDRGFVLRAWRRGRFQIKCLLENITKDLCKRGKGLSFNDLHKLHAINRIYLKLSLRALIKKKWLEKKGNLYTLTPDGEIRGNRIIRLHRLWEVYLFSVLGFQSAHVHKSAEEMEHIITPELEEELSKMLNHPKKDPHNQIIPDVGGK
jgi:manganese/zinc/iron transport system permease protein